MASWVDCRIAMLKQKLLVIIMLFYFTQSGYAQVIEQKIIQSDTLISSIDDEEEQNYDDEKITNDDIETEDKNGDFNKEVLGDTSITFSNYSISKDSINYWKNKSQYNWTKNIDSFLIDAQQKTKKQPKKTYRPSNTVSTIDRLFSSIFFKLLLWSLAIAFVGYIIYNLFLSGGLFKKSTKNKNNTQEFIEDDDSSLDRDYSKLLQQAYSKQDYKMAMRFLFLKTLQTLQQKEIILYTVDKTNTMYTASLPAHKRNDFAKLALYYEYVWYGNVMLQKEQFDGIQQLHNNFLKSF